MNAASALAPQSSVRCGLSVRGRRPSRAARTAVRAQQSAQQQENRFQEHLERAGKTACALALSLSMVAGGAQARMEGVNKPELLPTGEFTPVIDVAGFLTTGEENRIRQEVNELEADTGIKLRVLAQNYPETPGLAIRDYWGVDSNTVVFVADPNTGNILNFNVGDNVDLMVPRNFWTRLAGKYGTKFFWQEQGEASAILNAVGSIDQCLREPIGKGQCTNIQGSMEPIESLF